MALKKIEVKNITVFEQMSISFNDGINVFIGENGIGKTHIMKLLYAACKAAKARNCQHFVGAGNPCITVVVSVCGKYGGNAVFTAFCVRTD